MAADPDGRDEARDGADRDALELNRELLSLQKEANVLRAVELHLAGASPQRIADEMDVHPGSVRRWLREPSAQAAIAQAHMEQVRRVVHMSGQAAASAVRTLVRAMDEAPRWGDKIRAAEAIGRMFGMHQAVEAMHDVAAADQDVRRELAERLATMAERARSNVIEVGVVEPTPDEPDAEVTRDRPMRVVSGPDAP